MTQIEVLENVDDEPAPPDNRQGDCLYTLDKWEKRVDTDDEWRDWHPYVAAIQVSARPSMMMWAINALVRLCEGMGCARHPERLPRDYNALFLALASVVPFDNQFQRERRTRESDECDDNPDRRKPSASRAWYTPVTPWIEGSQASRNIRMDTLYTLVTASPLGIGMAECFPRCGRHRPNASFPMFTFRARTLLENQLVDVFVNHKETRALLTHKNGFNRYLYRFANLIEGAGLLEECCNVEDFEREIETCNADDLHEALVEYLTNVPQLATRRKYARVANHAFTKVWPKLTEKKIVVGRAEFDDIPPRPPTVEPPTGEAPIAVEETKKRKRAFDDEELDRIRQTAACDNRWKRLQACKRPRRILRRRMTPTTAVRDTLLLAMLRMGTQSLYASATIKVEDVAVPIPAAMHRENGPMWELRKDAPLAQAYPEELSAWLNSHECDGGRRRGPCPYLFPSPVCDNMHLSHRSLTTIVNRMCERAGFDPETDPRVTALRRGRHS